MIYDGRNLELTLPGLICSWHDHILKMKHSKPYPYLQVVTTGRAESCFKVRILGASILAIATC